MSAPWSLRSGYARGAGTISAGVDILRTKKAAASRHGCVALLIMPAQGTGCWRPPSTPRPSSSSPGSSGSLAAAAATASSSSGSSSGVAACAATATSSGLSTGSSVATHNSTSGGSGQTGSSGQVAAGDFADFCARAGPAYCGFLARCQIATSEVALCLAQGGPAAVGCDDVIPQVADGAGRRHRTVGDADAAAGANLIGLGPPEGDGQTLLHEPKILDAKGEQLGPPECPRKSEE